MNNTTLGEVTQLLQDCLNGDPAAFDALYHHYYPELHRQAIALLRQLPLNPQVQPTMIVDDVFLKLLGQEKLSLENRVHFKAWAVMAMWHAMVSYLRRELSKKNGGDQIIVPLDEAEGSAPTPPPEWFALHEAIEHLTAIDEVKGRIVVLRYFSDLKISEIAEALSLTTEQVKSRWNLAKAWLKYELTEGHIYEK